MLEKMTDLQFVLYVLAGISAVVLLQKIIVSLIYRHLKKETDGLPTVNDRWMKQLKLKYENTYKINSHMADTRLYVDRQVEKLKFFHAHLAGMNSFYRKAQLICILLGGTSYALAVRAGRTVADCHLFFVMGILAAVFLQLLDCLSGNERSEKIVKQNITDYFVNILEPKLVEPEAFAGTPDREKTAAARVAGSWQSLKPSYGNGWEDFPEERSASGTRGNTVIAEGQDFAANGKAFGTGGKSVAAQENAFAAAGSVSNVDGQVFSAGEKNLAAGGQCVPREEEDKIVREVLKEFLA